MLNEQRASASFVDRARALRKSLTTSERLLWERLRKKRCRGYRFRRQVPIGEYIVDFLCVENRLVVELDGDSHYEDGAEEYDRRRTAYLQKRGCTVLRFNNSQMRDSLPWILGTIGDALDQRAMHLGKMLSEEQGDFRRSALESKE